jgi:hypothetical protein
MAAAFMAAACVTAPITHLVSMEVVEGHVSTPRKWTMVAVLWIEVIVNVTMEVGATVEPGAGSDEDASAEPLWPVVSVWSAVVRGIVEVTIRANRRCSDIDGNLSRGRARDAQHNANQDGKRIEFPMTHK